MSDQHLLRRALQLDALVSAVFGVVLLVGAPLLSDVLGTPVTLLWPVAIICLVYAAGLWRIQSRPRITPASAWTVIGLNLIWALASIALVVAGFLPLTVLGVAFVLVQALVVAALADLQFVGLRRIAIG